MLGWFKKKFKKQEPVAPTASPVDDISTDTPFPEHQQPESDTQPAAEHPLPLPLEKDASDTISPPDKTDNRVYEDDSRQQPSDSSLDEDVKDAGIQPAVVDEITVEPETKQVKAAEEEIEVDKPLKVIKKSELQPEETKKKKSLFSRLTEKLGKTRETFTYQLDALFLGKKELDTEMLDDLEELLITADLGVGTAQELLENARRKVKRKELYDPKSLKEALKKHIKELITANDKDAALVMPDKGPFVIMVIGVNGVGKTTTIGKIARKFQQSGSSVMLVAGDTFRAAAVSQLQIWGERSNVPVIAHKEGADPSSVVFDALGIAQAQNIDVVLVDTAGRLHTKDHLMEELKKIKRVMGKKLKGAPHEVMLVIDATTGQNGISQARLFDDAVGVTGITLTKLDGTSKGGIVANICKEMKIPIRFIGIGEKMSDLRDFDAGEFVDALFHSSNDSL